MFLGLSIYNPIKVVRGLLQRKNPTLHIGFALPGMDVTNGRFGLVETPEVLKLPGSGDRKGRVAGHWLTFSDIIQGGAPVREGNPNGNHIGKCEFVMGHGIYRCFMIVKLVPRTPISRWFLLVIYLWFMDVNWVYNL